MLEVPAGSKRTHIYYIFVVNDADCFDLRLIKAENEVKQNNGIVLRLAGLYNLNRGPHIYWLSKGTVEVGQEHVALYTVFLIGFYLRVVLGLL
jgi:hypothetical protein